MFCKHRRNSDGFYSLIYVSLSLHFLDVTPYFCLNILLGILLWWEPILFGLLIEFPLKKFWWFGKKQFLGDLPISDAWGEMALVPLHKLWRSKARLSFGLDEDSVYFFFSADCEIDFLISWLYYSKYYEKSFYFSFHFNFYFTNIYYSSFLWI